MKPSQPFRGRVSKEDLPPRTVFIDTETWGSDRDDYQRLLLGCFEVWETNRHGLPNRIHKAVHRGLFRSETEFYGLLRSWGPCRVVAHNWQFDAAVLRIGSRATRKEHGYGLDPSEGIFPVGRGSYSPFFVVLRWADGVKQELVCNTNYHKTSLAKLGESFGLEKLAMPRLHEGMLHVKIPDNLYRWVYRNDSECIQDADSDRLNELLRVIKYCKRDVEILRKSWFMLYEFSHEVANVTPGITVASMGLRMFKARWFPRLPQGYKVVGNRDVPLLADAEQDAYHGGRVEVFWKGTTDTMLNKYDVNSMYPSCMTDNIPIEFDGPSGPRMLLMALDHHQEGRHSGEHYLAEVTVDIPPEGLGWLGWEGITTDDAGFVFPAGRFRAWAWQPMLWMAHNQGWIKEVHNVFRYRAFPIFRWYVKEVYDLRKQAKAAGDGPRSLLYKYLLNSTYGKFGQGNFGEWRKLDPDSFEYQHQRDSLPARTGCRWTDTPEGDMTQEDQQYWETNDGIYRWTEPEPGMGERSVCCVAGYITSLARATLLSAMRTLYRQGSRVYMCDTDSIITDGILPETMVGNELGKWELESVSKGSDCQFNAPKHYTFDNHTKCKGIRSPERDRQEYQQAQFSRWATDLLSIDTKRNERLEHGAMVKPVVKTVTGQNRKRLVSGDNRATDPIVLGS